MDTTKAVVYGALLTSLAIVIPLAFGGVLGVVFPPFSATLASHVPLMLAMLVSPWVAAAVGMGSAIGFLLKLGPVIAARAAMHTVVGFVGGTLYRRGTRFTLVLLATAPIHAVLEALIVVPFGFDAYRAGVVVGVGTLLHHIIDSSIALAVYAALRGSRLLIASRSTP